MRIFVMEKKTQIWQFSCCSPVPKQESGSGSGGGDGSKKENFTGEQNFEWE